MSILEAIATVLTLIVSGGITAFMIQNAISDRPASPPHPPVTAEVEELEGPIVPLPVEDVVTGRTQQFQALRYNDSTAEEASAGTPLRVLAADGPPAPAIPQASEFHPVGVVHDELGAWIPEAHEPAAPAIFEHVLSERVRWNLLDASPPTPEITA